MTNSVTAFDARERLRRAICEAGTQRQYAAELGVSESAVNKMLSGKLPLSRRVCQALGLERCNEVRYYQRGEQA